MNTRDYIESGILTQCLFEEASEKDTKKFFKAVKRYPEVRAAWEDIQQKNMEILLGLADEEPPLPPGLKEKVLAGVGKYDLITKGYDPFTNEYNLELFEKNKVVKLEENQISVTGQSIIGLLGLILFIIFTWFVIDYFLEQNPLDKDVSKHYREQKKQLSK